MSVPRSSRAPAPSPKKAIPARQLPEQAFIAKVDATVQTGFIRPAAVVHHAGREAIKYRRHVPNRSGGEVAEDFFEPAISCGVIGSQQASAAVGERELECAPIGCGFATVQQLAPHELIDCLAGSGVTHPKEGCHVADSPGFVLGQKGKQFQLGEGELPAGHFLEQAFFNNVSHYRTKCMRAPQEVVNELRPAGLAHGATPGIRAFICGVETGRL
jgi:hypothetical protein